MVLVDDSSRIARDIPDAIRVMQQLKFLGDRTADLPPTFSWAQSCLVR